MAKVELKQPIVEEIKASLDGAKGVVLVDHRGLTVEQDTVLFFRVHAWDHGHFQSLCGRTICHGIRDRAASIQCLCFFPESELYYAGDHICRKWGVDGRNRHKDPHQQAGRRGAADRKQ